MADTDFNLSRSNYKLHLDILKLQHFLISLLQAHSVQSVRICVVLCFGFGVCERNSDVIFL